MQRLSEFMLSVVAIGLATSCVGTVDEREVELDAGWSTDDAGEVTTHSGDEETNERDETPDASVSQDQADEAVDDRDLSDEESEHQDDEIEDEGGGGVCVEPCGDCTFGVDECCDHNVCQDDWSGVSRCMPVVPPTGTCPNATPTPGDSCDEPGLICRYTNQTRCKCGCDGWNCPFEGD